MNNRQEKPPLKCLLGIDPEKTQKCKPSECASCGWEAAEAARRREYVKEHGLTLCADGFRRLIIKAAAFTATECCARKLKKPGHMPRAVRMAR